MNRNKRLRVAVGLSGGMKSAVAAAVLKAQGHDVVGFYLNFEALRQDGSLAGFSGACLKGSSQVAAREHAQVLSIPFHVVDIEEAFEAEVIDESVHRSLQSLVRNPCIACHARIRIGELWKAAQRQGCERFATGHHAHVSIDPETGRPRILRSGDPEADQSYWLAWCAPPLLEKLLLPVGDLPLSLLKKLAVSNQLPLEDTVEAKGRCELNTEAWHRLVETRTAPTLRMKGVIRDSSQRLIGEHRGIHRYQLGARPPELPMSPQSKKPGEVNDPEVVTSIHPVSLTIDLGPRSSLMSRVIWLEGVEWLRPSNGLFEQKLAILLDAEGRVSEARVVQFEQQRARVEVAEPLFGAFRGAAVLLLAGDEIIARGWIDRADTVT